MNESAKINQSTQFFIPHNYSNDFNRVPKLAHNAYVRALTLALRGELDRPCSK